MAKRAVLEDGDVARLVEVHATVVDVASDLVIIYVDVLAGVRDVQRKVPC